MNYRIYSEREADISNRDYLPDSSQSPDYELVESLEDENYDFSEPQDMMPMYEAFPEDEFYRDDNMDPDDDLMNMQMEEMEHMHMENPGLPCCMMQNMATLPYMFELEDDEDDDKCDDVKDIIKKIEKHNPEVMTIFSAYGIPYAISYKILKRIIRLTLKYK